MRLRLLPASLPLGWTPYAWLAYLSFFVVWAAVVNSPRDWLIDGPALVVFLVLYFRGFWVSGRRLVRISFGILALGLLLAPRNPGASSFVIYAAAFLGEAAPPRIAFRWLAVIVAIVALESWLLALHPVFWIPAVALSLLVGGTNVHFAEMRRKDRALIKAHEEAEHLAAIAERERIARDLHDLLGHTLSVIVLKSELAAKIADRDPVRATAEIRDVERISRSALAEVRRAIHGYRGERLADEMTAARRALEAAGVSLEEELGSVALGVDEERALALGLREACTNVVRHARATRCRVTLTQAAGVVRLTIHDDGVGGVLEEGAGLAGMRGRLTAVGGRVLRDGSNGTRLMLEVPARAQTASGALAAS
ncbi:MAG TPA: sensor histidine kinase [Vicinamibacterales bacterium]|nr:sensor histidine kinase [Vicinamibacterales bacterium]